ncbi:glycoside hydrolase family 105 protein [Paenibacillus sp. Soil787]|uniref:glycoside hydrolase family 88/105 protein n=1 Tax=Paenibacillus sp. Soil787 TaxID=1736411 RepID=UPI00070116FF|nr:glycoside hydrolase family 88 protein [Paenibacillus sp. Soil787]KRF43478.1 glycosyl hydrolase [Paenibacillus sp. Soil787]
MTVYFQEQESAHYRFGDNDAEILKVLAQRYIGANPQAGFVYRTFHQSGVLQNKEGLYEIDLSQRFPSAKPGQWAYGAGVVWSDEERNLDIIIRCLGPVRFFFNGSLTYRSNVIDEMSPDASVKLNVTFTKGWNTLFIKMKHTPAGFGCLIGSDEAKVRILNVLAPFKERQGKAGWVFSAPVDKDMVPDETALPDLLSYEQNSGLSWFPGYQWNEEERELPSLERMYGRQPGKLAFAWTRFRQHLAGSHPVNMVITSSGPITVWINGKETVKENKAGHYAFEFPLSNGVYDLLVKSVCGEGVWGYTLTASIGGAPIDLYAPHQVHGSGDAAWLYVGPFQAEAEPELSDLQRTDRLYATTREVKEKADYAYWRLDLPHAWIRPYYENSMLSNKWTVGTMTNYARWDYPLGVTIYGLLQTGRFLHRPDMIRYATEHVQACTDMFDYSLWDAEQYGFPAINQQLVMMKMLDNCGSFGSAMLEAYRECGDNAFLPVASRIADFMLNKLERREDGAFYRTCPGEYSADTMWADDLYMSTPFLRRYAEISGDARALDEAAKQFLRFRNYLFMPEQRIMSHVYDFKYGRATGIPWGRGNGWVLFSLTEVLEVLPETHEDRAALLEFFNELCEGYLVLQSDSGLWHQVLNASETYLEASCTAMFAYAFARGVRFSWLREPNRYAEAAFLAWNGLSRIAIDRQGNVHGVCSGSRYAFHPEYYNEDLRTVTNDNHGIGIMMLAGTEVAKLKGYLSS